MSSNSYHLFDLPILPQVKPLTIAGVESTGIVVPPATGATEPEGNFGGGSTLPFPAQSTPSPASELAGQFNLKGDRWRGKDIVSKIMTFLEQELSAVCILSGVGVLCKVTLRRSKTAGGTMTHEGQFDITSLSGSFIRSKSGLTGFLNLSVTSPDGSDFGGVVAGKLRAVTLVQVTLRCFSPYVEKPESKAPSSTLPPNLLNFGPPVTKAGSSSQVPEPTFEGQAM
ncbi:putative F-box protein SKIP19-like [Capsicum annuum]|nr:putative F-box protein SKIP19-like [Capsicum annuum]